MNTKLTKWLGRGFAGLLTGGLLLTAGCADEGVVAYSDTPDSVYYDYDYYPSGNVYYYPAQRVYYWNDGTRWVSGPRLPEHYRVTEAEREHLRLHSREPWTEQHREGYYQEQHEEHPEHHDND